MKQLGSSILWRFALWLLVLLLIPMGAVYVFTQQQMRESFIAAQLEVMRSQSQVYFTRVESAQGQEQALALELAAQMDGDDFFLIGNDGIYLAHSKPEKVGHPASEDFGAAIVQQLLEEQSTAIYSDASGQLIGSYRPTLTSSLAVSVGRLDQKISELNQYTRNLRIQLALATLLVLLGALVVFSTFLTPITRLMNFVNEIKNGNLNTVPDQQGMHGELSELSSRLKDLAGSLQDSFTAVQDRMSERTHEIERQSNLLKAVAGVGKAITSFRNLSELLQQTTLLIHENFGYYHVGIFLLDDYKDYAILAATNSQGGQRMLEKKHQLKIGETSIVGHAIENTKARIALDVGKDAVYFGNPELPETRSEMALPLVVGGQTLGALDVQSRESQAFSEEDVSTLQILADQIAVAIQNANLFSENEKALEAARVVSGEVSRDAWSKILRNQPRVGFIATPPTTIQTHGETPEPTLVKAFESGDLIIGDDGLTISVPIKIRGQAIGAIRLKKSEIAEAWTQDETNLAIALSDQLSGALESARLYRESQQRAARESLVSDISARISAVSHIDAIVRETVQELGQALGNASVSFQLLDQADGRKQLEGGALSASKDSDNGSGRSAQGRKAGE